MKTSLLKRAPPRSRPDGRVATASTQVVAGAIRKSVGRRISLVPSSLPVLQYRPDSNTLAELRTVHDGPILHSGRRLPHLRFVRHLRQTRPAMTAPTLRILIVEDNRDAAETLAVLLRL